MTSMSTVSVFEDSTQPAASELETHPTSPTMESPTCTRARFSVVGWLLYTGRKGWLAAVSSVVDHNGKWEESGNALDGAECLRWEVCFTALKTPTVLCFVHWRDKLSAVYYPACFSDGTGVCTARPFSCYPSYRSRFSASCSFIIAQVYFAVWGYRLGMKSCLCSAGCCLESGSSRRL